MPAHLEAFCLIRYDNREKMKASRVTGRASIKEFYATGG